MPSRDLILKILGDATGAGKALKETQRDLKETGDHAERTGGHFSAMGKFAAVAGGAIGVGLLIEGLKGAVEAASAEETAQAGLDAALRATHQSVKDMTPALEEASASSRKLGFSDVDTEHALTKLEIATGNTKKSISDLSVVQDIARVKHTNLEAASTMLAQAMTGSQRAAKQLGIAISPVTENMDKLKRSNEDLTTATGKADVAHAKLMDKMATGQAVIAAVTDKVHGQAQAYSQTAAGGMDQFKVQMEHLQATIGEKLIPVLTRMLTAINNAVVFIEEHWPQISAVFEKVAHVVESAWENVGRPVFEAVITFSRRVIAFVEDHWPEISAAVRGTFNTIRTIVDTATDVIMALWRAFGGTIKTVISNNLDAVEGAFHGVFTTIKGVVNLIDDVIHGRWSDIWGDLKQIVSGAINAVEAVLGGAVRNVAAVGERIGDALKDGIVGGLHGLGGIISGLVRGAINMLIDEINSFHIHIPSISIAGHKIGGEDIGFDIPHLAGGGIVTQRTLAVIGEAGPEAVVPLRRGGGFGSTINVTVNGVVAADKRRFADDLANEIQAALLRKGQANGGRLGFG